MLTSDEMLHKIEADYARTQAVLSKALNRYHREAILDEYTSGRRVGSAEGVEHPLIIPDWLLQSDSRRAYIFGLIDDALAQITHPVLPNLSQIAMDCENDLTRIQSRIARLKRDISDWFTMGSGAIGDLYIKLDLLGTPGFVRRGSTVAAIRRKLRSDFTAITNALEHRVPTPSGAYDSTIKSILHNSSRFFQSRKAVTIRIPRRSTPHHRSGQRRAHGAAEKSGDDGSGDGGGDPDPDPEPYLHAYVAVLGGAIQ